MSSGGAVIDLVFSIEKLCNNSSINKRQLRNIAERCQELVQLERSMGRRGTQGQRSIQLIMQTLDRIQTRILDWSKMHSLSRLLLANGVVDDCHTDIENCMRDLNIEADQDAAWRETGKKEDHQDKVDRIEEALDGESDSESRIRQLQDETQGFSTQAASVMGIIQEALPRFGTNDERKRKLQKNFMAIKTVTGELPPIVELHPGEVTRVGQNPVTMKPTFDIWEGLYMGQEKVALKVLRFAHPADLSRRFHREVVIWKVVWERDRGAHFLPYYGILTTDSSSYMVSPWQENGSCLDFLLQNPEINRTDMIRHLAKGLDILHTWEPSPIVHGDIRCENILMSNNLQPIIADFGLAKIVESDAETPLTQSKPLDDSLRWVAPEVYRDAILSYKSDVYSFAMTVVEMITCEMPYFEIKNPTTVVQRVLNSGLRPTRPKSSAYRGRGLTYELWRLLEQCWVDSPDQRLTMSQFLERF